ncbi:hypothetical protein NHX12_033993 [Muraenolepis orangiensis]|uniref:ceramidase n=1 Tax=Muraenolepis orangiensis TaxID=630683 RepID=A0A9Q0IK76_9TELE|nr:hypothetical protein NHX12_033993 [Muraenolepis orangiensis]
MAGMMAYESSEIDWCEDNYRHSEHVVEYFNTMSSLIFFIVAPLMLYLLHPYARERNLAVHLVWVMMIFVGVFSAYFHMTLSFMGQMLDELSILGSFSRIVLSITVLITVFSFIKPTANAYTLHMFGLPLLYMLWAEMKRCTDQRAMRLAKRLVVLWALALVCWISDRFGCSFWQELNFCYLHGIWHIMIVVAMAYSTTLIAFLDANNEIPYALPGIKYWPSDKWECTVQVKLELGHRAQLRKKVTSEGFTHDWMVFVRGPEAGDIQHFVDKVVFRLHESFPKPKRVCKEPPYKVEESGYAGFLMPIEVYFKNKEEPKKVCFNYDLFLNLEGNPPVNHLRCEKLTFNNPTKEFRRKLVRAGGVMVVPEGAEAVSRPSPDYPMLPTIPLSAFSDPKKTKTSHVSKVAEPKAPGKRASAVESPKPSTKKQKKGSSEGPKGAAGGAFTGTSPRISSSSSAPTGHPYPEKRPPKEKGRWPKTKSDPQELKEPKKPPESDESNSDDDASSKSEKPGQGTLRTMVEQIQSEESDDDDSSSEEETLSLDSESDSSDGSHRPSRDPALPPQKHGSSNNKVSGPEPFRSEKVLKKGYDKAYTEELVDLHRRLMALRERNVLQQIVNLIEETGHFNVTNTTFDFDLFSLDESTVRKLQSYLEATAT